MKVRKRADELQITKPTNAIAPLFANDRTHTKNILEALIYKHQVFTLQCRTVASFLYFHPHHIDPYMSCRNSSETKKWRSDLWKTHKKDAKMLDFFLKAGRGKAEPDHDMWNTDVYEQYEKIAWDEAPNLELANYKSSDDDTLWFPVALLPACCLPVACLLPALLPALLPLACLRIVNTLLPSYCPVVCYLLHLALRCCTSHLCRSLFRRLFTCFCCALCINWDVN